MDEYGEEDEEADDSRVEEEQKPKEKPVMPVFDKEDFIKRWLEDNPVIEIPSEEAVENDADWVLTEEEEQAVLQGYLSKEQN